MSLQRFASLAVPSFSSSSVRSSNSHLFIQIFFLLFPLSLLLLFCPSPCVYNLSSIYLVFISISSSRNNFICPSVGFGSRHFICTSLKLVCVNAEKRMNSCLVFLWETAVRLETDSKYFLKDKFRFSHILVSIHMKD